MPRLVNAYSLVRLATALRHLLDEPLTLADAQAAVQQGMRARENAFLQMVRRVVFGDPANPYRHLCRAAGCELGDVQRLVERQGLEGALTALLRAGIYVTFEEFKGRVPAVRGSQRFEFRPDDFDNPLSTTHFPQATGGTSGPAAELKVHLDHIAQNAPHWALLFAEHDLLASPLVFWIPSYFWLNGRHLICAKFGKRYAKWFTPVEAGRTGLAWLGDALIRWGTGLGSAEYVPLSEPQRVGTYLADLAASGMRPCINTTPSAAVRIALAMQERGVPLTGVTFLVGAEPLTETRRQTIEESGAGVVATYGFSEGGGVGAQCRSPATCDEVHVFLDAFAIIDRARLLEDGDQVNTVLFTSLRPACPKILLNTEIGDSAVLARRACACLFGRLGYSHTLHTIRSFDKLTGEGITVLGADLYPLLERTLPQRFGGTAADYQLIERQEASGVLQYDLRIAPTVGAVDERRVVIALLEELGRIRRPYRIMAGILARGGAVRVRREAPLPTARGKILPFRTLRSV